MKKFLIVLMMLTTGAWAQTEKKSEADVFDFGGSEFGVPAVTSENQVAPGQFGMGFPFPLPTQNEFDVSYGGWCRQIADILYRAQVFASPLVIQGNYSGAISVYERSVVQALGQAGSYGDAFSVRFLQKLLKQIKYVQASKLSIGEAQAFVQYLGAAIEYSINLSLDFDFRYFVRGNCGYCNFQNTQEIFTKFIDLAYEQTQLVVDHFYYDGGHMVYPIGSSRLTLAMTSSAILGLRQDLVNSPWAPYYSCQIRSIEMLLRDINSQYFPGNPEKINFVYYELNNILSNQPACHF